MITMAMAAGALVLSAGDDTVTVWRAERDLSVGSRPVHLAPASVSRTVVGDL